MTWTIFRPEHEAGRCGTSARTTLRPSGSSAPSPTLLNSDFVRRRATEFACRLQCEFGSDDIEKRVSLAFQLALGRAPNNEERAAAGRFLPLQYHVYIKEKDAKSRAWTDFCQMIFACNSFLYVQ